MSTTLSATFSLHIFLFNEKRYLRKRNGGNKKRIAVKDMGNSSITFEANPKLWEREREREREREELKIWYIFLISKIIHTLYYSVIIFIYIRFETLSQWCPPLWLLVILEHCRNLILRRFANCNHKNRYSKSHRMNQLLQFSKKIKKRINSYKHMGGISGGTKGDSWLWINIHYCFLVILPLHKTQWSMTVGVVES